MDRQSNDPNHAGFTVQSNLAEDRGKSEHKRIFPTVM